ncbi:hypothetical protein [Mesotoga prima]|uniref:hypothetical protein n=1 Tax=Mesotoga prima TaxID=1184387 RepID=UPI002B565F36|nr:hypothetical protein [Mesotoga prima]MDK2944302.1 hypothetical protein [Mesotoga sp.]HNQ70969.1 hypothetical protein [Mesotoga prima]HQC14427.1 hypothetical protein [Mesotoga prima]
MNWYVDFVRDFPFVSAIIQFSILGTLGDFVSARIARFKTPFPPRIAFMKALEWAFLAIFIKIAFIGYQGFVSALVINGVLPSFFVENLLLNAFARSLSMNLQFGVFLVLFHRLLDNLVLQTVNWKNMDKALISLIWFWIPAHTLTFALPKDFQIGLAALWSFMLGLLLSLFSRSPQEVK